MEEDNPLPYIAIGAVFIPWLEARLKEQNANQVSTACTFREAAAKDGIADPRLNELIGVELGEWLPEVQERDLLLSHFGPNTKKACHYHIVRLPG